MKKLYILFSILQSSLALGQSDFNMDFDYARFYYNDSGYVEIYYSFYQPALTVSGNSEINGLLSVEIKSKDDNSTAVSKTYSFKSIVNSTDTTGRNKSLAGNLGYLLGYGEYVCTLKGRDGNDSTKSDSLSFALSLTKIPEDRFTISDLELSSSIKETEDNGSMFYKNTFEVIPNPGRIFGENLPVLFFYSEIYNLDKEIQSENIQVTHLLLNNENKAFYKKSKLIPRKSSSIVEVGAINISKAPSGTYALVVNVSDSLRNLSSYSSKKLFIYNPSVIDSSANTLADTDIMSSEFSTMIEEDLNEIYGFSRYIASSQEEKQWNSLNTVEGKRKFLFNFWKSRDTDAGTPVNEYKRDYMNRVQQANSQYSNLQRKGWKTDRGRVLICYGEPSEIERYPNQVDTRPYEIWYYNQLEGGIIFVFADLTGFSDYQLIHSTLRGELRDDNWQRKIITY